MKTFRRAIAAIGVACCVLSFAAAAHANCGDGILDDNEECDGGPGGLYIDGDPALEACSTGSRCYYSFTCCKFNCQYVGTPGVPCQDGDNCSGPDVCDQVGVCNGGPAVANGTPCDDGLFCTGVEGCQDGECVSSTGNPCPETACNLCQEDTDSCFNPAGSPCSDGSSCVTGGTCNGAGTCTGGVFNEGPCDDGLYCNGTDTCQGGACTIHSGDPCASNVGDADADCSESCDEAGNSCTATDADDESCDDGLFCNGTDDSCQAGSCSGTGTPSCDDDNSCTTDGCVEISDTCSNLPSADGAVCDDGDPCSLDDTCESGICEGTPVTMDDLCPWTVVLREDPKRDQIKTNFLTNVDGDMCGGTIRLSGLTRIGSDLVSSRTAGAQLRIAVDVTIGDDIVSAGAGARGNPGSDDLPYLTPPASQLADGSYTAKNDASGVYDLTGTHDLAGDCADARASFPTNTTMLDALPSTDNLASIMLPPAGTQTITATVPGALNVIDVDGNVKLGKDAVLTLSGAGNANTVMVLRVAGKFGMLLRSSIELAGGLTPEHLLIYVSGKKCLLADLSIGAGTVFCSPARVKTGRTVAWVGAIYGDGRLMKIGERTSLFFDPFQGF